MIEIRTSKIGNFAHLLDTETSLETVNFKTSYFRVESKNGIKEFNQKCVITLLSSLVLNEDSMGSYRTGPEAVAGYLETVHNFLTLEWVKEAFLNTEVLKRLYNIFRIAQTFSNHPAVKREVMFPFAPTFRYIRRITVRRLNPIAEVTSHHCSYRPFKEALSLQSHLYLRVAPHVFLKL